MINTEFIKPLKNNAQIKTAVSEKKLDTARYGVLADAYLKPPKGGSYSFDNIRNSLLINNSDKYCSGSRNEENKKQYSGFNVKKAALPILAGSLALACSCWAMSAFLKKSSGSLLKTKSYEQLPDLAVNMNIKEEPHFAIYKAVRDPNFRNIAAACGVFLMSGITIACKNAADGAKDIWIKKQSADIEANLQESLIAAERDAFSGKLKIVNDIMQENAEYFENVIKNHNKKGFKGRAADIFAPFEASFKGIEQKKQDAPVKKERKYNLSFLLAACGITAGIALLGKYSLANLRKSVQNTQKFAQNYTESALNAIERMASRPERSASSDIPKITELMKSIGAKPVLAEEIGKKYNLSDAEIKELASAVEASKKTIFADAPQALGGIPKKVQYYCYLDESRGHLYNWMINPENKFTKFIFASFTTASAAGYAFKLAMDALKEKTVMSENAKTDFELKKRLAAIDVKNFRAKKECAVMPLIDNFKKQAADEGKSREELKELADNILREIKNGPPYVFG